MAHARGSQAACRSLHGCPATTAGLASAQSTPQATRTAFSAHSPQAFLGLRGPAAFPGQYVQARDLQRSCQLLPSPNLLSHQQPPARKCSIESRGLPGVCRAAATGAPSAVPPRSPYFDPPGFVDDLTSAAEKRGWSDWISRQMDRAVKGTPSRNDGPRRQFLNPSKPSTPLVEPVTYKDISWTAFPRQVDVDTGSDSARWAAADKSRDVQDEYCEWSVTRDPVSKLITKVTFTSEGPEYWDYLASVNPDKVLALYQQHISADVKKADLFDTEGNYNRRNKWNSTTTRGAMHLIQDSNSLSAEIELAGGSSIVRTSDGQILEDSQDLIQCGQYGAPGRNSDPHIGSEVNALARANAFLTLKNPVALYIDGLDASTWTTPDGTDAQSFWKVTRGAPGLALRAVYEVPKDKGYTVGEIQTARGQRIEYGAQIADFIQIRLTGAACRIGEANFEPVEGCVG
ncbi:hypothetical protein KFL_006990030 [Klebsormidium nitens]|uniref:Uncharacterized protein n=1 Tax=Klebsormidium nitens TaxID=105231 RepID=A0A1Y1IQJ7_KLENI|nr:hypothetical protein KFL_006990030 [Klebsormidium nitens]|eukprot:GAQ90897.1 hypothetical protein KFL_006990030 [Klebsormidium nitens]